MAHKVEEGRPPQLYPPAAAAGWRTAPPPRDLRGTATLDPDALAARRDLYLGKYGGPTGGQFQRWLDRAITSVFPDLSNGRLSTTGRFLAGNVGLWLLIAIRWGTAAALISRKRWRHLAVFVGSVVLVTVSVRWFPTAGIAQSGITKHPAYAAASLAVTVMGLVYGLVPAAAPSTGSRDRGGIVRGPCGRLDPDPNIFAVGDRDRIRDRLFDPLPGLPCLRSRSGLPGDLSIGTDRAPGHRWAPQCRDRYRAPRTAGSRSRTRNRRARRFGRLDAAQDRTHRRASALRKLYARPSPRRPLVQARAYGDVRSARGRTLVQLRPPDGGVRGLHVDTFATAVPTAEAYGFAEITPEREYLLVTSFIDEAVEVLDAPIDDTVIAASR